MRTTLLAWAGAAAVTMSAGICRGGEAQYIQAYTDRTSYVQGDTIGVSVSTTSPTYTLQVIRVEYPWNVDEPVVAEMTGLAGVAHPNAAKGWLGAGWPVDQEITIGAWQTGDYVAKVIAEDGTAWYHPFFVRPAVYGATSNIAFIGNFNTANAYNAWGGKSFYADYLGSGGRAVRSSFLRPHDDNNGIGRTDWLQRLHCHLEEMGFVLEYVTEWDVEQDPCLLEAYDVLVFGGHHEYVTGRFYDAIQAHHDRGGHMAFFSADDIYWQVRYEEGGAMLVGYKGAALDDDPAAGIADCVVTTRWHEALLNRPAEALKGVRRANGFKWFLSEPYLVQMASHWIFQGTGVQDGEPFGDGIAMGEQDYIKAASPDVDVVLYANRDMPDPQSPPPGNVRSSEVCAIYYADTADYGFPEGNGGMVFSAGTVVGWINNLGWGNDTQRVRQVTANVLQGMLDSPPPAPGAACAPLHTCAVTLVPEHFATIQAAVDAASPGEVILVSPGVYAETIDSGGKPVSLYGVGGHTVTTIDATGLGGSAITLGGGPADQLTVSGLTIRGGDAVTGGGLHVASASVTISDCVLTGNSAQTGGGLSLSGGSALVFHSIFINNTATDDGGGVYVTGNGNRSFVNCVFADNTAGNDGGGVFDASGAAITNCIAALNAPNQISGGAVTYSLVAGGAPGAGNVDGGPVFVDAAGGNYRLAGGSPAIDAGLNAAIAGLADADPDGNDRFKDDPATPDCGQAPGSCGAAPIVDMGVFEFQPPPPALPCGDADGNGTVDVVDLLAVLGFYGNKCPGCRADFDHDGVIGVLDLLIVLGTWGPCGG